MASPYACRGEPPPARFNLARHCLAGPAAATPDKTALVVVGDAGAGLDRVGLDGAGLDGAGLDGAERWSYAALDLAVRRVASGLLAEGLVPGDRLLVRLGNGSDYALTFFGAIAAGLVPIPVAAQLSAAEAGVLLAGAEPAAVAAADGLPLAATSRAGAPDGRPPARILDAGALDRLKSSRPLPGYADTAAEDPAYMVYTSGTSRRPKGVVHAQRSAWGRRPMHRFWQGLGADDVMLHAGAFNWSYTLGVGLIDPWSAGATAVLYTGPKDVQVWPRLIRAARPTLFAAVPSLFRQILKHCAPTPADMAPLRHGLAAGEALSPAVLAAWRAATGLEIYEAFGMSECSTFVSTCPGMPARPGSPGRPQPGRSVAILPVEGPPEPLPPGEVGLLAIHRSDPGLMLGYWRRPEEAASFRGEWFVGGDLASLDAEGYLHPAGRADDVMNAGGFRVSPAEVEAALSDHPAVAEAAVREFRVREDVSVIAAWIVPAEGARPDADAILAHAGRRLAPYKRPRQVFFVGALPRTANGKLLRRALPGAPPGPGRGGDA